MPLVHQLHHPDKNTGTNTTANVAVIISPIIPVPMACGSPNWPRQEEGQGRHDDRAQECGLKRCVDQVTAWSYRIWANSMIRSAFLAGRPMMVTSRS